MTSLAVYTTVYPGVEPFLADWYASVARQTDADFRLWIGLDVMDVDAATTAIGAEPDAVWVRSSTGDTPGSLRQRALAQLVERHDAVVLVDSDDLLHSSRVETA
ncbi:MAG TPA: glycosyltransferase family A protein, partial [Thermoleophilia bacterium]|nr:glycosyltransferase family A protein [Thermoleophilia bacterium]